MLERSTGLLLGAQLLAPGAESDSSQHSVAAPGSSAAEPSAPPCRVTNSKESALRRIAPNGPLTSRLCHIKPGDEVLMARKPTGTLVLDALTPASRLFLLSTGILTPKK